jgi:hypothetical protein
MLICFLALIALTRWITKHVQGIGYLLTKDGQIALILYFLLILPGVLVHELSHAAAAWLLRVRIRRLSIGLQRRGKSQGVVLGSVEIAATDPIRASLIGLAPLTVGCALILAISNRILGIEILSTVGGPGLWHDLNTIYGTPDFWLWIYLVLTIGNAMLPSAADRQSWGAALAFIAFIGALLYLSGLLSAISSTLSNWGIASVRQLTYAFAVTVAVDVIFAILLFLLEQGLAALGLGRVQYN